MDANQVSRPQETLPQRRARVQQQLQHQRAALASQWQVIEHRFHVQERRILGFTRGFRAVLSVGALAGGAWLIRRFGPGAFARPLLLALSGWQFVRRFLPFGNRTHRTSNGHSASRWIPLALTLFNTFRSRRKAHQRRADPARAREKAYRGGRRDGRVRRQP